MYCCNNCAIAHEERDCPLCEAKAEIRQLEKRIEELENEE
jgi:hypothetical protein